MKKIIFKLDRLYMEQNYEGIIGSDARNLIDVLMYQAGGESFNR